MNGFRKNGFRLGCCMGLAAAVGTGMYLFSCGTAPQAFVVRGPGNVGNEPPSMTILEPVENITRDQGAVFLIRWSDSDRDSNALISFFLVSTTSTLQVPLVAGIEENDTSGPDSVSVGTSAIPVGQYHLRGLINDGENPAVEVFATVQGAAVPTRVVVTIVPPGQGQPTRPPQITVTEPVTNLSVAQDDVLRVVVQPTDAGGAATPFDPDSEMRLFVLLDTDLNPRNDDPANPADPNVILLREQVVAAGTSGAIQFDIPIDLNEIPPRPNGEPYFIRATVDDLSNPRVHRYAVGTISVVELASGLVDLADIGRTKAGATFYGFNPGAATGFTAAGLGDFDEDGIDDFMLVARFGNPRNVGLVGEGYLIYGLDRVRFGGSIAVNSVGTTISGAIFEAPPIRRSPVAGGIPGTARSDGITSVAAVPDMTGDGRPEIFFGLPHVHGAFDSMDYDPADETAQDDDTEQVTITLRQGTVTIEIAETTLPALPYTGVDDLTLDSADPNNSGGASSLLSWQDDAVNNISKFALIKFSNVLSFIPDANDPSVIDPSSVNATLSLRVVNTGDGGNLHQSFSSFTEQTTFNTYSEDGGAPTAGLDYNAVALGGVAGDAAEIINVDITALVRLLIDGELGEFNNEIRLIIVPGAGGADETTIRSSEASIEAQRPTLVLTYSRISSFGAFGCFPDPFVNNFTSPSPDPDLYWYGGGMAVLVNSQNRDNDGIGGINPARLESTAVSLELVGQESWVLDAESVNNLGAGAILVRADNAAPNVDLGEGPLADELDPGHISGGRFVAGWFDLIDHQLLRQAPREGLFGQTVSSIGDLNNDGVAELMISAPRNERYLVDLLTTFGFQSTHWWSTGFRGSIVVIPGTNYNDTFWRDVNSRGAVTSTTTIPSLTHHRVPNPGSCQADIGRTIITPADTFQVFAEDIDDMLGGATSAGDFNQDGLDDILCGAYLNDRGGVTDSGAVYILYGRSVPGDYDLTLADNPLLRAPMLRIRGEKPGDQIGWRQVSGLDVNGDRIDDVFFSSPRADFGGVTRSSCGRDFNGDGVFNSDDLSISSFNLCRNQFNNPAESLFSDDACKAFDYDNDRDIDSNDLTIFNCLNTGGANCCANLVDNGFVGVMFGGVFIDGDRSISQLATPDLPGTIFFGSATGHQAGYDVSSAGDFNKDGFGDLLIAVPGEIRVDTAGRPRVGVVYLVFGGTHLENRIWNLSQVGTADLPGIVFLSPFVTGRPNEAPPLSVAHLGDINNDGFSDIFIGNEKADFIDLSFPQGPDAPGLDAEVGRRRDAGQAYVIYGNNFGTNRGAP